MKTVVTDIQFGDTGKGRIVYELSKNYDYVVRFSSGNNCGHTVYDDGRKIVRNLVPCIDFKSPNTKAFLGSNMVIDLNYLIKELEETNRQFPNASERVIVDPEAFIVTENHLALDKAKNAHIGTTGKGIGPAYVDKVDRKGTQIVDILKLNNLSSQYSSQINTLKNMGVKFLSNLQLKDDFKSKNVLFESAQSVLLSLNGGTYPYVTSCDTTIAGIFNCGFNYLKLDNVIGVTKAYCTRVGNGPFPTEITGNDAIALRERGGEYGATTGRPRRVGWLDMPMLNYAIDKGGVTELAVTKLDILDGVVNIPYASNYAAGTPTMGSHFFDAAVQYSSFDGWNSSKEDLKNKQGNTFEFVKSLERLTNTKVSFVSVGTKPEDLIKL